MHAGEANNGSGRRAHGAKFSVASGETTVPAGIQNEKCTPAWRGMAATSGHTETNFPAGTVETTIPAGIQNEKCPPAR